MASENSWSTLNELEPSDLRPGCIKTLLGRIEFDALANEALALRSADTRTAACETCHVQLGTFAYGRYNVVFTLIFDNGVEWIARVRIPYEDDDEREIRQHIFNEVAVIARVREHTSIPIPQVFGHNAQNPTTRPVGALYMLMDKVKDEPLDRCFAMSVPQSHMSKIAQQFGTYLYELSRLRFNGIGELEIDSERNEKLIIEDGLTSPLDYFHQKRSSINQQAISHDPHNHSIQRACQILDTVPPHIVEPSCSTGPFAICHSDFHYNNVLVDKDYNITAVLDWSNLETRPWELAAANPEFMGPISGSDADKAMYKQFTRDVKTVIAQHAEKNHDEMGCAYADLIGSKRSWLAYYTMNTTPSRVQSDAWLAARYIHDYDKDFLTFRHEVLEASHSPFFEKRCKPA